MTTTVDIQPVTATAPEGHDERMAALADARAAGEHSPVPPAEAPATTGERPEFLPEKFKTVEDMAKAYAELEKRLGQAGAGQEPPAAEGTQEAPQLTPEVAGETSVDDAAKAAADAGIDYGSLYDEYLSGGSLTEESYSKLEQSGIPRDVVDAYIAGQEAQAEIQRGKLLEGIGGEAAYASMVQWAQENLSQEEIQAYDRVVTGNDLEMVKIAVAGLHAKYSSDNPASPRLINGGSAHGLDSFQSWSQVTEAMKDPRYQKDPAYQRSVQDKIGRSQL